MEAPVPNVAPVAPDCIAVHEKVVPGKLLEIDMALALPEQILSLVGVAVTVGLGLTVIVKVWSVPAHEDPVPIGVTLIVAVIGVTPEFVGKKLMDPLPLAPIPIFVL